MGTFLVREPTLISGGSDGSEAPEAYRVTASIVVMPVLEAGARLEAGAGGDEVQMICFGHVLACLQTPERPGAIFILRFRMFPFPLTTMQPRSLAKDAGVPFRNFVAESM